jgi:hypothetical protein
MKNDLSRARQMRLARWAGAVYLAFIAAFAAATFFESKPIVHNDAAGTAKAILAAQEFFRLGVVMELVAALLFLLAAWMLYVLLKPAGRNLALLFLLLNAVGVGIECVDVLIRFTALTIDRTVASTALQADQLQALALIFLKFSDNGNLVTALFYSVWLFPLGFLVIKSRLLPKIFGILLFADGISLLICFVQMWFFPGYERWMYPLYPVMFVAEFGLGLWLVIKGARVVEPAPSASASQ